MTCARQNFDVSDEDLKSRLVGMRFQLRRSAWSSSYSYRSNVTVQFWRGQITLFISKTARLLAINWNRRCTPSMGVNQMGFKSPVHRTVNAKAQRKAPAEDRGGRVTGGLKEVGRQSHGSMNKNRISGRARGVSGHQTAKPSGSTCTVNAATAGRRFTSLSGEIPGGGTAREVSRRHSSPTPEVMLRTW